MTNLSFMKPLATVVNGTTVSKLCFLDSEEVKI